MNKFKLDVLNTVIRMTRDTGQGLSGIVCKASSDYNRYLNELENENKVEKYTIYNNYLPNDIWYLPKGIYSVWSDTNYMKSLSFIRKYLKIESFNDIKKILNDKEYNKYLYEYEEWLNDHKEQLEEIVNLKLLNDDIILDDTQESFDNIKNNFNVFKEKHFYKNNLSLKECIYKIKENIKIDNKIIDLYNELIIINKQLNYNNNEDEVKKIKAEKELKLNSDFEKWLNSFDENEKIQTIL